VPETRCTSCDLLILVKEPVEAVASFDLGDLGEGTALLRLDRQLALDLFEAFGTEEKTLHANMGGHTGVPPFEGTTGTGSSPGT
jgi:hypothetical protein